MCLCVCIHDRLCVCVRGCVGVFVYTCVWVKESMGVHHGRVQLLPERITLGNNSIETRATFITLYDIMREKVMLHFTIICSTLWFSDI